MKYIKNFSQDSFTSGLYDIPIVAKMKSLIYGSKRFGNVYKILRKGLGDIQSPLVTKIEYSSIGPVDLLINENGSVNSITFTNNPEEYKSKTFLRAEEFDIPGHNYYAYAIIEDDMPFIVYTAVLSADNELIQLYN